MPSPSRRTAAGVRRRRYRRLLGRHVQHLPVRHATRRTAGRLPGLPSPVYALAVSPDGSRFAAGLARGGVRVWDAASGKPVFEDSAYAGPVRNLAFDRQGRLFTAAGDGKLRAYDPEGRKSAEKEPAPGQRPWGLAVSPDGSLLAVAYENADRQGRLRVDVVSTRTLQPLFAPDADGLKGEGLLAVAWAANDHGGVALLAGGYARSGPANVIRRWDDFGFGPATDLPASRDTILDIRPVPGGGAVFSAEDPGWGRIAPDGNIASRPVPPMADLRSHASSASRYPPMARWSSSPRPRACSASTRPPAGSPGLRHRTTRWRPRALPRRAWRPPTGKTRRRRG
jgi:hypothetical protein